MNTILTSTDHTFPDSLRNLGLNPAVDIIEFIIAGEGTPDKAFELLTKQWGVGHNLAVALIDHYGDNIYNIEQKLDQLDYMGETFVAASQLQVNSVVRCLGSDVDKKIE